MILCGSCRMFLLRCDTQCVLFFNDVCIVSNVVLTSSTKTCKRDPKLRRTAARPITEDVQRARLDELCSVLCSGSALCRTSGMIICNNDRMSEGPRTCSLSCPVNLTQHVGVQKGEDNIFFGLNVCVYIL